MKVISARNLSFEFNSSEKLFENLNFDLDQAEIVALLGPSGCGKSTLLRILMGLIPANSGDIERNYRRYSTVFQDPRLLAWRNVRENITLPFELVNAVVLDARENIDDLLKEVSLTEAQNKYPFELSGGMKMRCSLARALATKPELLYLDEPFSALDEETREKLQFELRKNVKRHRRACVFVTHSIDEACFIADRIVVLGKGKYLNLPVSLPNERDSMLRSQEVFFKASSHIRKLIREK